MDKLVIIDDINKIEQKYHSVEKFNSHGKIVDKNGKSINSKSINGHYYCIVDKKERKVHLEERIGRVFLGSIIILFTLGTALLVYPKVIKLFKGTRKIHFAMLIDDDIKDHKEKNEKAINHSVKHENKPYQLETQEKKIKAKDEKNDTAKNNENDKKTFEVNDNKNVKESKKQEIQFFDEKQNKQETLVKEIYLELKEEEIKTDDLKLMIREYSKLSKPIEYLTFYEEILKILAGKLHTIFNDSNACDALFSDVQSIIHEMENFTPPSNAEYNAIRKKVNSLQQQLKTTYTNLTKLKTGWQKECVDYNLRIQQYEKILANSSFPDSTKEKIKEELKSSQQQFKLKKDNALEVFKLHKDHLLKLSKDS